MATIVLGWLLTTALIAILAFGLGRRKRPTPTIGLLSPEPKKPQSIYTIAESLSDFYRAAAQPSDLLSNEGFREGVALFGQPQFSIDDLVGYLTGDNAVIACMAGRALAESLRHEEASEKVLNSLNGVSGWALYFALELLAVRIPAHESSVGMVLKRASPDWDERYPRQFLKDFIKRRRLGGEQPALGSELAGVSRQVLDAIQTLLRNLGPDAADLLEELQQIRDNTLDLELLRSIGSVWTSTAAPDTGWIIEHSSLTKLVEEIEASLLTDRPRSVVLVGESGVGKSVVTKVVTKRLLERGWTIFEAGHAELIAGRVYIGEFEEQLQKLLRQLCGRNKVLWVVPSFPTLALSGRHKYSPVSALDIILPHVEQGELVLLGESHPAPFERLAQSKPRCVTALDAKRIEPLKASETAALVRTWMARHVETGADEAGGKALASEASHLAQHFLGFKSRPGNVLELLELTRQRITGRERERQVQITNDDLILTLSQLTGLPERLLDERIGLDLQDLRAQFNRRVIGQPEAVDCLVERVAMIKAGVTDPMRPYGVFLFAGPTGTGKTEIAKTLAEFLFGSSDRMARLDMSEFQSPDSLDRILGTMDPEVNEALVDHVRKQPFSAVLLDEFEKAHEKIWDVFLQVFDDGRLTDRRGNMVDFRHTIIILTSNLGGVIPSGLSLGFSKEHDGFRPATVGKAVGKTFRKEFLNRIDRMVVFKPLSREVMRQILQKELALAFQRRGLRTRNWAVEWDESAVEFLLSKGFTEDLGARPLKRAIDRYLLSPLATTIVNRQVPEGDQFLFVTALGDQLRVEFVDPDAPADPIPLVEGGLEREETPAGSQLRIESLVMSPTGRTEEIGLLRETYASLQAIVDSQEWKNKKESALALTNLAEFWSSEDRFEVLGQYEYQDRIESGMQRAGSLLKRLMGESSTRRDRLPRELVATLAHSLYLLKVACEDVREGRPREAFLVVEASRRAEDPNDSARFAKELGGMYGGWARKRRMRWEVIDDTPGDSQSLFRFLASVSGYGAYSILAPEEGLHILESPDSAGKSFERCKASVRVLPQSGVPAGVSPQVLKQELERRLLAREGGSLKIVRRYRREPSPLVRDSVRGWRTGKISQVLGGDFDLVTG